MNLINAYTSQLCTTWLIISLLMTQDKCQLVNLSLFCNLKLPIGKLRLAVS